MAASIPSAAHRFTSPDGMPIAWARWDSRGPARGVIQIAHGMGEHIRRHAAAIEALRAAGLTVYGNDHRGHGRTVRNDAERGDFGSAGFAALVGDMVQLSRIARAAHPGLPFFLLGHGMGSFAAQMFTLAHSQAIDGLILSGAGMLDGLAYFAGAAGTNLLNAAFEPARTPADWLSRDRVAVDAFIRDPLCFAELQPAAMQSFLSAAPLLNDPARLRAIRDDLPVYLFSGSEDPVGQQLRGVRTLITRYRAAGIHDITHDFYAGGRHDMLNETNRGEVLDNLLAWIGGQLGGWDGIDRPMRLHEELLSAP